jgi:predicted phosphoesterases, related to the icc protein
MKILVLADAESTYIWDHFDPEAFAGVDLVISCGDLKASYLSFIVTMLPVPLLYVPGNHDSDYLRNPPLGCDSIDDQVVTVKGLRIMGLGGSYRYKPGPFQYNEAEMTKRVKAISRKIEKAGGIDLMVTHSPSLGLYETTDLPHRGFDSFNQILETYKPSYFLHGHVHMNYSHKIKRRQQIMQTTAINGYQYYIFDYEPNGFQYQRKSRFISFFHTK